MKKRLLFLPSWYPDSSEPLKGIFVHEQAVALSKKYDVAVLAIQPIKWWRLPSEDAGLHSTTRIIDGIRIYVEHFWMFVPRTAWYLYPTFRKAFQRGWRRLIREWGKPELLHAHVVLPMGDVAVQIGTKHNIPVVLTEHSSPFSMHLKTNLQRQIVIDTLRKVNQVVAVSPSLGKTIQSFVPEVRPQIVGELVRTDFFTPGPSSRSLPEGEVVRFLSVGFLVEQKGVSILLAAMSILRSRGLSKFEVIIGGDGKLRIPLERQAETLQLLAHCRFAGSLDRLQVREEMRRCDVFVLPSLHETFGIVVGEAMACGKPVIATRCGGPDFVVTPETGLLIETDNTVELAEAMETFIQHRVKFDAETIRQSVVRRFGEDAFVSNMTSIYDHVMLSPPVEKMVSNRSRKDFS